MRNDNINDDFLDNKLTYLELKNTVFSQNNNNSSGIDIIITEMYKSTFSHISQFLLKFFNYIFTSGDYPKSFGEGIIVPVFKGET